MYYKHQTENNLNKMYVFTNKHKLDYFFKDFS